MSPSMQQQVTAALRHNALSEDLQRYASTFALLASVLSMSAQRKAGGARTGPEGAGERARHRYAASERSSADSSHAPSIATSRHVHFLKHAADIRWVMVVRVSGALVKLCRRHTETCDKMMSARDRMNALHATESRTDKTVYPFNVGLEHHL